jgi:hypothetical protein
MADMAHLLVPHCYPQALGLIRDSFARQPDGQTCGAAALCHGLLLGGLTTPVGVLEALLDIRANEGTDYKTLLDALARLGFEPRHVVKPARQGTEQFFQGLCRELEGGAFLLPCIRGGMHWVCAGAWDGTRLWLADSYDRRGWRLLGYALRFSGFTAEQFDDLDWEGCVNVVQPGRWREQYLAWLPARPALLHLRTGMRQPAGTPTAEAALQTATHHYLNDAAYTYAVLELFLQTGVQASVPVADPGADAVNLATEGTEEGQVLVVRRLAGALGRKQPPELVLRAGALRAAQLS